MSGWPARPVIYEMNTAAWLTDLSRAAGRRVMLGEVAEADWDAVTPPGVDAVWLMGVWTRSPAGLAVAEANPELRGSFRQALPDLRSEDVIGSAYCVRKYEVDPGFGGPSGLATARAALAARGVRLILDYVPNHVAPDHPWALERPDLFIEGDEASLTNEPDGWQRVGQHILAHGRDPYFPPWPDVLQFNAFSSALRAATAETLSNVADQCDGIRCDMAMLMINQVFAKTWAGRIGVEPAQEFWPEVIGQLRAEHPETVLLAEAYWGMEGELLDQGFNFCYDKELYDHIVATDAGGAREHLRYNAGREDRLLHFLENHDEPRVADRMATDAACAAAVATATLPGATLWHEGQFEGRRVHLPVFLARRPDEPADEWLAAWYFQLLDVVGRNAVRRGDWQLLEVTGWPDNQSCGNLLCWSWCEDSADVRYLVVVNLSGQAAQGRVLPRWPQLTGSNWQLSDLLRPMVFERDGDELAGAGLYVDLAPWECYLMAATKTER